MAKLFIVFIFMMCSRILADVNYCVPFVPQNIDPHKILDPVEDRIVSRVLKTLLPRDNQPGVAESWKQIDPKTWRVTLKPGKFNKTLGWKGLGDIGARDVKFSIDRQMKSEGSIPVYMSARLALKDKLKEVKVNSFRELDIIFLKDMPRDEFEKVFSSQVGYVISEEFHQYKQKKEGKVSFFATTGEYTIEFARSGLIQLAPAVEKSGSDKFFFKYFRPEEATAQKLKAEKCHYVFNPTLDLQQSIKFAKLKTTKLPLSTTRWFLIFKSDSGLEQSDILILHRYLAPKNLKELNAYHRIFNLSGQGKWVWPHVEKVDQKFDAELQVSFCQSNIHYALDQTELMKEIKNKILEATGIRTNFYPASCEDVRGFYSSIDASGAFVSFTFKKEEELLDLLLCGEGSETFCLTPDKKNLESLNKAGFQESKIFPLFEQENYFLRVY